MKLFLPCPIVIKMLCYKKQLKLVYRSLDSCINIKVKKAKKGGGLLGEYYLKDDCFSNELSEITTTELQSNMIPLVSLLTIIFINNIHMATLQK